MPRHIKHSVLPVWSAMFRIFPPVYWTTQHLHLGFFLMVTCSACCGSWGRERCTSTWPGRGSTTAAPFFVPFIALGVLCCTGLAAFVCGEEGALVWKFYIALIFTFVTKFPLLSSFIKKIFKMLDVIYYCKVFGTHVKIVHKSFHFFIAGELRCGGRRRRDGLTALDQRYDLVCLAAQVAVRTEWVVPSAFRAEICIYKTLQLNSAILISNRVS